jgi:deoxyribose-phosphate aldolase
MSNDGLVQAITAEVQRRLKDPATGQPKRSWHSEDARLPHRQKASVEKPAPRGPDVLPPTSKQLAQLIDHTLLRPEATDEQLRKVCAEARQYNFKTVCVNSCNVRLVAQELSGSSVLPIAVVGFPLGAQNPDAKAYETRQAIRDGAKEIDMVINIGALKSTRYAEVLEDIRAVVEAAAPAPVKVILETSQLSEEEKVISCALSKAAGAAFVKTSTGFDKAGATVEDITLMRRVVGPELGVKASGGVRSKADVEAMVRAGATRVGASSSVTIVTGGTASGSY